MNEMIEKISEKIGEKLGHTKIFERIRNSRTFTIVFSSIGAIFSISGSYLLFFKVSPIFYDYSAWLYALTLLTSLVLAILGISFVFLFMTSGFPKEYLDKIE